jgi:hypothetical protein
VEKWRSGAHDRSLGIEVEQNTTDPRSLRSRTCGATVMDDSRLAPMSSSQQSTSLVVSTSSPVALDVAAASPVNGTHLNTTPRKAKARTTQKTMTESVMEIVKELNEKID